LTEFSQNSILLTNQIKQDVIRRNKGVS
jgi:hypothetical protein